MTLCSLDFPHSCFIKRSSSFVHICLSLDKFNAIIRHIVTRLQLYCNSASLRFHTVYLDWNCGDFTANLHLSRQTGFTSTNGLYHPFFCPFGQFNSQNLFLWFEYLMTMFYLWTMWSFSVLCILTVIFGTLHTNSNYI